MTAETLSSVSGVVLSLVFSYVPGLSGWYEKLNGVSKRLVMLVALLAVSGSVFGLSCSGWWDFVTCDQSGLTGLIEAFVLALVANQAAYLISPVKE